MSVLINRYTQLLSYRVTTVDTDKCDKHMCRLKLFHAVLLPAKDAQRCTAHTEVFPSISRCSHEQSGLRLPAGACTPSRRQAHPGGISVSISHCLPGFTRPSTEPVSDFGTLITLQFYIGCHTRSEPPQANFLPESTQNLRLV